MESENAGPFERALRNHDWYHSYSDDFRVWQRGEESLARVKLMHVNANCPFTLSELCNWVHDMIFEEFEEVEPGKFYHKDEKDRKFIAPSERSDLILRSRADEIVEWMKEHDRPTQ